VKTYARFIELKVFVGSRGGGVGVSSGPQTDLLARPFSDLHIVDDSIRWILAMGGLALGSPRYAIFTSFEAQNAAMNGIGRAKTNNLRVTDFQNSLITWNQLSGQLHQFLLM
jgi:hypothetical protein